MSWFTLDKYSGETGNTPVPYTATTNDGSVVRIATVTFTNDDGLSATSVINQNYVLPYISVSPTSITFPNTGGSESVYVRSDSFWEITNLPNWITVSGGTGYLDSDMVFTASRNESGSARTATVTIGSTDIVITQPNYTTISVDPSTIDFGWSGGSVQVTITTTETWRTNITGDWFSLSQSTGSGETTITISASANESEYEYQSGIIYFIDAYGNNVIMELSQAPRWNTENEGEGIILTFNVPSTTKDVRIGNLDAYGNKRMFVDGVEVTPSSTYRFSTTGTHEVELFISTITQYFNNDSEELVGINIGNAYNGTIQAYAFSGCSNVTNITIGLNTLTIGSCAFSHVGYVQDPILIPKNCVVYANAFDACKANKLILANTFDRTSSGVSYGDRFTVTTIGSALGINCSANTVVITSTFSGFERCCAINDVSEFQLLSSAYPYDFTKYKDTYQLISSGKWVHIYDYPFAPNSTGVLKYKVGTNYSSWLTKLGDGWTAEQI